MRKRVRRMGVERVLTTVVACLILTLTAACAKPKVQVQVSRNQIEQGEEVRVNWTSKSAKTVTLNGEQVDKAGARDFTPDATTNYLAVARRGKKEARDSKEVIVNLRVPKPTIMISADQSAIERGQSTTLRWNSSNSDQVIITDVGEVPTSGSRVISPSDSTTYTATATGRGGSDTASTRVTVTDADPTGERPRTVDPAVAEMFGQWVRPVFFDFDKANLTSEAKEMLNRAAEWLTSGPNRSVTFRIEGNCDARGTAEYNIGLGERRAQAAKEYLISLGVDPNRIQTISYGEEKAQGTSEGRPERIPSWAHDRRDDFIYIGGGSQPMP